MPTMTEPTAPARLSAQSTPEEAAAWAASQGIDYPALPDLLFSDQVAELAGVEARTVNLYTNRTKNTPEDKRTVADFPLPAPEHRTRREIPTATHPRVIGSAPRWPKLAVIIWLSNKRGPGGDHGRHARPEETSA
jgi:hypothetical protein